VLQSTNQASWAACRSVNGTESIVTGGYNQSTAIPQQIRQVEFDQTVEEIEQTKR